jgi:lipopolysaccharide biosynthesis regulator YciM
LPTLPILIISTEKMDELLELKQKIIDRQWDEALAIATELEEMSKDDKINSIGSFCVILLLHIIKQEAEQRTTKSWDVSIKNCLAEITKRNKRRKSGGTYLSIQELTAILEESYELALLRASVEAFEGRFDTDYLDEIVDRDLVLDQAKIKLANLSAG